MSEDHRAEPVSSRLLPYYRELKEGVTYLWCRCGRTGNQPFCDGSHRGTGIRPLRYTARCEGEEILFCACRATCDPPHCDGAHNNLREEPEQDDPDSPGNRRINEVFRGPDGIARLDGRCFVRGTEGVKLRDMGGVRVVRLIGAPEGALYQSLFLMLPGSTASRALCFGDSHAVMLVTAGRGEVIISDRSFALSPETGVYVRPGEVFSFRPAGDTGLRLFVAVGPLADGPEAVTGGHRFDHDYPERTIEIDLDLRERMGERFFQMLVDRRLGSSFLTQFLGEIPLSKAPPHRHLYEESLVVLRGSGMMWTESRKTAVGAGDVIFLPRKQVHSLQCTDPEGMFVAGVIYPGDNPTINY